MSKTVYYLGAGASYGRRNKSGKIIEGLPIVSELPKQFNEFRQYISNTNIPKNKLFTFFGYLNIRSTDLMNGRQVLIEDIDELSEKIREHATIDTYARKLHLIRSIRTFEKLKNVLCLFFIWEQIEHKVDNRYDTFLANILEAKSLSLPKDINIISWNYDSQLEIAYGAYRQNQELPIFEKNIEGQWPEMPDCGCVFKVNGSATFADRSVVKSIIADKTIETALQLICYYSFVKSDTTQLGFQYNTHLSFAWEDSVNNGKMMDSIAKAVADAEQVVVIGYSFPYFNRETDRLLFQMMPNLKKVYIQDKNTVAVSQSIVAVIPEGKKIHIEPISDCTQFYLPAEL